MKVKIIKVREKDERSLWRLSPIVSKPSDDCFSIIKKRYLWFNGMIIGYRFALGEPCGVSFAADKLDLSAYDEFLKEIDSEPLWQPSDN